MIKSEKIGGFILNLDNYNGEDLYSEGDVEEELLKICQQRNFKQALKNGNSWSLLYHFSSARENLLDWYEFKKNGSLLEIGSGCGALTGLFCKKVSDVTCIELSKRRSLINAYKNGSYGVAEIIVGNFQDIQIEKKYDYITLIGVLEYAKCYLKASNPFHVMLNKVKESLKEDGRLIIAIENKMGLKYFAGAAEDHTGIPFDGINNYIKETEAVTFSKIELVTILQDCGFNNLEFFYPMPDYKLPTTIYSDDYLPESGELRTIKRAYAGSNYQFFDEELAYDTICNDKQFPYFANSFLVFAGL